MVTSPRRVLMVAYHFPPLAGGSGILRTLGVSSRAEVIAKYGMLSPSPSTPRQAAAADH